MGRSHLIHPAEHVVTLGRTAKGLAAVWHLRARAPRRTRSASRARAVRINLLSSGGLRDVSSSVEFVDGPAAMVARPSGTTI